MPRGLKKRFGTPAVEGSAEVRVCKAKILSVNPTKYTCSIQSEFDNRVVEDVPIEPMTVNVEGGGSYWMPETNSVVWTCFPSTGNTPFIMSGASLPKQTEGDDDEDPTDRRLNRPVLNEGDMVLAQNGTAKIILRKGGLVEIGAGESALRRYIPLTNLIEEFSQNWRHNNAAGLLELICRDKDETYGVDRTPAEFKFNLREFCEDEFPMMDLRIGRIKDEDDQAIPGGDIGSVVARLTFDNRVTYWIDREGNCAKRVMGTNYESYHAGRKTYTAGTVRDVVVGTMDGDYLTRNTLVKGTDDLKVQKDRTVSVGGNLTETVSRSVTRRTGAVTETVAGGVNREVQGRVTEKVTGAVSQEILGRRSVAVGQEDSETVGRKSTIVTAAQALPTDNTYTVYVNQGGIQLHSAVGRVLFSSGNIQPEAAVSKFTIKPNGTFIMSTALGTVKLEQNASGLQLSTPAGVMNIDVAGTVQLGPGPVRGNVLTTLSFPFDLTTGAPTTGTPSVQAGGGPGVPGPSALPSTFVPDVTP